MLVPGRSLAIEVKKSSHALFLMVGDLVHYRYRYRTEIASLLAKLAVSLSRARPRSMPTKRRTEVRQAGMHPCLKKEKKNIGNKTTPCLNTRKPFFFLLSFFGHINTCSRRTHEASSPPSAAPPPSRSRTLSKVSKGGWPFWGIRVDPGRGLRLRNGAARTAAARDGA